MVGVVLLGAGISKARRVRIFAAQVAAYSLLPKSVTLFAARLITMAEIVSGVLLLAGLAAASPFIRTIGATVAVALFLAFTVALGSALVRGAKIQCACGAGDSELEVVGPHSVTRAILLLALAVLALLSAKPDNPFAVIGLAAMFAAFVAVLSELARLFGPLQTTTAALVHQLEDGPSTPRGVTLS